MTEAKEVTPGYTECQGCGGKSWGVTPDVCKCGSTEFEEKEVDLFA